MRRIEKKDPKPFKKPTPGGPFTDPILDGKRPLGEGDVF